MRRFIPRSGRFPEESLLDAADSPAAAETALLARRQAELVRALVAGAQTPAGFDAAALAAAAHALLHKRARVLARRYPLLTNACGEDFTARFIAWADGRPKISTDDDAAAFAEYVGVPGPTRDESRWRRVRLRRR